MLPLGGRGDTLWSAISGTTWGRKGRGGVIIRGARGSGGTAAEQWRFIGESDQRHSWAITSMRILRNGVLFFPAGPLLQGVSQWDQGQAQWGRGRGNPHPHVGRGGGPSNSGVHHWHLGQHGG